MLITTIIQITMDNNYYTVGKYKISTICYESFPCQHDVINLETNTSCFMSGDDIYSMLKADGLTHMHFNGYEELVRKKYNNPTAQEILDAEKERAKC